MSDLQNIHLLNNIAKKISNGQITYCRCIYYSWKLGREYRRQVNKDTIEKIKENICGNKK